MRERERERETGVRGSDVELIWAAGNGRCHAEQADTKHDQQYSKTHVTVDVADRYKAAGW